MELKGERSTSLKRVVSTMSNVKSHVFVRSTLQCAAADVSGWHSQCSLQ